MRINNFLTSLHCVVIFYAAIIKGINAAGCSIQPTNAVVVVDEEVSFNCSSDGGSTIDSLKLGSDASKELTVYQASVYRKDGTVRVPEYIADGYYGRYLNESDITIQMNKTSFVQAGLYHCICQGPSSTASANLAVLAKEPEFLHNADVAAGSVVNFTCSMWFNGTAIGASLEMTIKDSSGSNLRQTNVNLTLQTIENNKHQVIYSVIADPNVNQTFICTVKLNVNGSPHTPVYYREKNASISWKDRDPSNPQQSGAVIPLVITVVVVIIIIIIVVIVYFKHGKKKTQPITDSRATAGGVDPPVRQHRTKPGNQYDRNGSAASACTSPNKPHQDEKQGQLCAPDSEIILMDNDLYGSRSNGPEKRLDPSDGYTAEEPFYSDIKH